MRTITKNIYSFSELSESAKQKAIKEMREDYEVDFEFILDEIEEELKAKGFTDASVKFSISYSQGDGASFDARITTEDIPLVLKSAWLDESLSDTIEQITIRTNANASRYSHEKTRYIDVFFTQWNYSAEIISQLEGFRYSLSHDIYKRLVEYYESETSDESIASFIDANEYEFHEDWKRYY